MSASFESSYVTVNGVRLHYKSAGSGKLVLFLHGFPEFWRSWEKQLAHFGDDYLAVAPDLRGYNLSQCPPEVKDYRAKHLIEDIRQLAATFTREKFVLVAHDWGGAVAWGLAIAHPELLSHLVIINSPHPIGFWRELANNPAQQKASEYMLLLRDAKAERVLSENNFERLLRMRFAGREEGAALEADKAAYLEAWRQPGALTGSINYYRASPLYPPTDADPGAAKLKLEAKDFMVRVPTLVLWGEKDRALLPSILEGIEEVVPNVEVVRVPDATHWVMEEKPDLVNTEIRKFISKENALSAAEGKPGEKLRIGDLSGRVGEEIGVSPWLTVSQERIDLFAKAIDDPQWIHVDPGKAKQGPYGTTIAHGFLTLSLLSHLVESTFSFEDRKMGVNYGLNKVRFTAPLPSGSRIRARFVLAKYETLPGNGVQNTWNVTVEREGGDKPVLVAEWLVRSYS